MSDDPNTGTDPHDPAEDPTPVEGGDDPQGQVPPKPSPKPTPSPSPK